MKTEPIRRKETEVCGETINNIDMPGMYRLAMANKAALEETIKSIMQRQGFKKVGAVLAMLESDLG